MKQFTKPLGTYHFLKRFFAIPFSPINKGKRTKEEFDAAQRIGKEGDRENQQRIVDKMEEKGWEEPDKKAEC